MPIKLSVARTSVLSPSKKSWVKVLSTVGLLSGFWLSGCSQLGPSSAVVDDNSKRLLEAYPVDPNAPVHFDADAEVLNFSSADCKGGLYFGKQGYDDIVQLSKQVALGNLPGKALLNALNELDRILEKGYTKAMLQANVHPQQALRTAAENCQQEFSRLFDDLTLSRPIYDGLVAIDSDYLNRSERQYLTRLLRDLKRSGVDKDQATRDKIKQLNEQLTELGQTFSRNIREDVRSLEVASADLLKGLPEDYIAAHVANKNDQGNIVITTDYPDFFPVARYAESDSLRKDLYTLFRDRGYPANDAVLLEILSVRWQLAQLLGYDNYADYVTEDKMIKSAENAQQFIDKISVIATPRAEQDYQVLLDRMNQFDPSVKKVSSWQKGYLAELVRKEQYSLDSKKIREYFNYPQVEAGIFELIETLYGVKIKAWDTPVWHESVKAFQIFERGELIGQFFIDMHPRENKYKHAAHFPLISGLSGKQVPTATLVCNFPEGLMEHGQVNTFLHEFGHLLHHVFSGDQQWLAFSGVSTERDFVEAPSQMLEEWVWDYDTLQRFAKNEQGEVIPKDLVAKMNRAKKFGEGMDIRGQMFFAALSLDYYRQDPKGLDLNQRMNELQRQYSLFEPIEGTHFYANFGHLYGYSAMYYTYMWSLVIASDMFSEFETHGLLNSKVAARYRKKVLAPGGLKPADELVEDFLGRPYNYEAFNKRLNEK